MRSSSPNARPLILSRYSRNCDSKALPMPNPDITAAAFWRMIHPLVYDMTVEPKVVDLRSGIDNVAASSNNFYENVTQKEVEDFYDKFDTKGNAPSWGLNSKTNEGRRGNQGAGLEKRRHVRRGHPEDH